MKYAVTLIMDFGNDIKHEPYKDLLSDYTGDCWDRLWPKAAHILAVGYIIRGICEQ